MCVFVTMCPGRVYYSSFVYRTSLLLRREWCFIISLFVSRCSINLLHADIESNLTGHHKCHIISHCRLELRAKCRCVNSCMTYVSMPQAAKCVRRDCLRF